MVEVTPELAADLCGRYPSNPERVLPPADLVQWLPYVRNIARGFPSIGGLDVEDHFGAGCLGLVVARANWKGSGPFFPYALKYVRGFILKSIRDWNFVNEWSYRVRGDRAVTVSLSEPIRNEENEQTTIGDILPDPNGIDVIEAVLLREVKDAFLRIETVHQDRIADYCSRYPRGKYTNGERALRRYYSVESIAHLRTKLGVAHANG